MISPDLRKAIFNKCSGHCAFCGIKLETKDFTIDHLHPRSKGGEDTYNNLLPSCRACNNAKGNYTLNRFRRNLTRMFKELAKNPLYRLGKQYGFITEKKPKGGKVEFYFEKHGVKPDPGILPLKKKKEFRII